MGRAQDARRKKPTNHGIDKKNVPLFNRRSPVKRLTNSLALRTT